jgi:hypothetical protein
VSDIGDDFKYMRELSQKKRASNREHSADILAAADIPYVSKNGGAHLIVADRFDFWPGTGLWMERGKPQKHRGVAKLIARITK